MKLSRTQRESLAEATRRYSASLPGSPAAGYLAGRGLMSPHVSDIVAGFQLGYVEDPLPEHQAYRGFLAIPYLRKSPTGGWFTVTMRFRCIREGCEHRTHGGKYLSQPGGGVWLYNTVAVQDNHDEIAICEGEIDAITATLAGIPAVGVPGTQAWKPHFRRAFVGYEKVFVLADGDDPGMEFAAKVADQLPNVKVVPMPKGEDVNSYVLQHGKRGLMERVGK